MFRMITRVLFAGGGVLAFVAGVQLFFLAEQTDVYFAWTIQPPLTAAVLGAFFWSSGALFWFAYRDRESGRGRLALLSTFPLTTLLLIATLLHLDRFNFTSPNLLTQSVTWVWLVVYIVLPPVSLVLLFAQSRVSFKPAAPSAPVPSAVKAVLAVQGTALLIVGAALFLVPQAAAPLWPWKLTPLTSQAIASWLISTGFLAWVERVREDYVRPDVAGICYGAIGALQLVAVARFAGDMQWSQAAAWLYLLFVASIFLVGAYVWYRTRLA